MGFVLECHRVCCMLWLTHRLEVLLWLGQYDPKEGNPDHNYNLQPLSISSEDLSGAHQISFHISWARARTGAVKQNGGLGSGLGLRAASGWGRTFYRYDFRWRTKWQYYRYLPASKQHQKNVNDKTGNPTKTSACSSMVLLLQTVQS